MAPASASRTRFVLGLKTMTPAYFGMAMATGIVSIAAHLLGHATLALALFALNVLIFGVLWVLLAMRLWLYPRHVLNDLMDHLRGPGFFTTVAACGVLGSQCVIVADSPKLGAGLWIAALLLWIGLTYAIFAIFTVKQEKPTLDQGINGGWLLAVVATQSLSVLASLLAARMGQPFKLEMNFFALSMWLWGGMQYIWMMSLIFYRYTFFRFSPADLSPPYWINMGAMAISTLGGALLILNAPTAPFLESLLPFIKGFTVFYWATGTWWIPMLVLLAIWRHGIMRFPLRYDPLFWGAVFPVGMYTACTKRMVDAMALGFLDFLPRILLVVALLAWTSVFIAFVVSVVDRFRATPGITPAD